jgi:hypothetical protein
MSCRGRPLCRCATGCCAALDGRLRAFRPEKEEAAYDPRRYAHADGSDVDGETRALSQHEGDGEVGDHAAEGAHYLDVDDEGATVAAGRPGTAVGEKREHGIAADETDASEYVESRHGRDDASEGGAGHSRGDEGGRGHRGNHGQVARHPGGAEDLHDREAAHEALAHRQEEERGEAQRVERPDDGIGRAEPEGEEGHETA